MNPWNVLFPFQKYMKNFSGMPQTKDMESFIKNMFNEWQKQQDPEQASSPYTISNPFFEHFKQKEAADSPTLDAQIFETHHDVYVRLPVKDKASLKDLKIFHTSNTFIIEGFPDKDDRHVLTLPAIVKKKGGSAQYREQVLEIRLPKANDLQYSEINVTEL